MNTLGYYECEFMMCVSVCFHRVETESSASNGTLEIPSKTNYKSIKNG
jgi:hypothetical protein